MKKIYSLVAVLATTFAANAQTPLNTNGDFATWPDPLVEPSGWFMTTLLTTNKVERGTTGSQSGDYHLIIKSPESGNTTPTINDITANANEEYSMTYWYKSEPGANYKHWIQFRNESGAISGYSGDAQPSENLAVVSEWTQVVVNFTTPPGTTRIRAGFRNYNGANVHIDNANVFSGPTASVKENNIEGLRVYPNPASDIVNISSNEIGTKEVVIFNMLGKKVLETSTEESINTSNLNSGVYIMNITQDGKKASRKLVIK